MELNGDRPQGWELTKLSDLGEVNRGRSRHRPRHAPHLYGGPYPFIQTGDIKAAGGRITCYQQSYNEAGLAQSRLWPAGTMSITIAANIAETAILTFPACFPDSVIGFIANKAKCDVRFVEYMFRYLRRYIQHVASDSGTVQDNINLEFLENLRFPVPKDILEQYAIARILGTLDDKIALNRRMNQTLEGLAQALFQSWFVDFDPVTARAAGRPPVGMSRETAKLFPKEFVDSEMGPIPKGWGVGPILEHADLLSGGTPKTTEPAYWEGDIPWASAGDVSQCNECFLISTSHSITKRGLDESATRIIDPWSTVIVARGATTGRMTMFGMPTAMNQTCYALRSKTGSDAALHCQIKQVVGDFVQAAYGTVFDTITTRTFEQTSVVLPSADLLRVFEDIVKPLFRSILARQHQCRTLAALRDALLPRLLSGELRVKDAEKIAEKWV